MLAVSLLFGMVGLVSAEPPLPTVGREGTPGIEPRRLGTEPGVGAELPPPVTIPPPDPGSDGVRYRLEVEADGLYQVTGAQLAAAGIALETVIPSQIAVTSQGAVVAVRLIGMEDQRFDPADAVEFYGTALPYDPEHNKYSTTNVYWVTIGTAVTPTHMSAESATPGGAPTAPASFWTTLRLEEQNLQWTLYTTIPDGHETFFWERMVATGTSREQTLTATIPDPAAEPYTATLQAAAYSRSTTRVRAELTWEGAPVAATEWVGSIRHTWDGQMPGSALQAGENTLLYRAVIDASHPLHDVYFDYAELTYRRRYQAQQDALVFSVDGDDIARVTVKGFTAAEISLYDISQPQTPVRLTGASIGAEGTGYALSAQLAGGASKRYLAVATPALKHVARVVQTQPSGLRASSNQADYLIVTHSDFMAEAQRLANFRQAHDGFRIQVIPVEAVYAEFTHGLFHPEAIRRLVAHALANWAAPAPQYLLLIGDGNWNFPQSSQYPIEPNYIPPISRLLTPPRGRSAATMRLGR